MNPLVDNSEHEKHSPIQANHENCQMHKQKINSARNAPNGSSLKRNLFILSNQNTKIFPSDFFASKERSEYYYTERDNDINKISKVGFLIGQEKEIKKENECSDQLSMKCYKAGNKPHLYEQKIIYDIQKETEEDTKIKIILKVAEESRKENQSQIPKQTLTSPQNANGIIIKGIFGNKNCEMIPEEDEDRIKTESGKYFHLRESQTGDLGTRRSISNYYGEGIIHSNLQGNITINKLTTQDKDRDTTEQQQAAIEKVPIPTSNEELDFKKKKSESLFKINKSNNSPNIQVKQPVDVIQGGLLTIHTRQDNGDSNPTVFEVKKVKRTHSASGNTMVVPSFRRNSKEANTECIILNTCEKTNDARKKQKLETSPILISNNPNHTPKKKCSFSHDAKNDSNLENFTSPNSNYTMGHNSQTKKERIYSMKSGVTKNFHSERGTNKTPNDVNLIQYINNPSSRSNTPTDQVQLPLIDLKRKNSNEKFAINNIASIFEKADDFKEDPVIKKKLDDIIQNISDIRTVLNQKTKNRMKIASAPTRLDEREGVNQNVFKEGLKLEKGVYSSKFADKSKKIVKKNANTPNGVLLSQNNQKQNSIMKLTEKKVKKEPIKIMRK